MGQGVWIVEEHDQNGTQKITLELIREGQKLARRLKQPLCLCIIGNELADLIAEYSRYGVEKIHAVDHAVLADYALDLYSQVLSTLVESFAPAVVMLGSSPMGTELASRVAAQRKIPCITDVKKIVGKKDGLTITKSVYDDQAYATIRMGTEDTVIVTIAPGETDAAVAGKTKTVETVITEVMPPSTAPRVQTGQFLKGDPRTIRITEAERIVAGGRGAEAAGFTVLREFADLLGAAMAGSRAAVDDGLVPVERQIGISGNTVAPKLLITGGISGAREFTVGMENAELVIAINTDEKARIFEYANLCLKGDVEGVLASAIETLRSSR